MKQLLKYGISNQTINELTTVNSRIKHFLCWLVTIALILNALGTYAPWIFANNNTTIENPIVDSEESKYANYGSTTDETFNQSNIEIDKEIISERTLSSKTFQRVDGSYVVAYYPQVIHYEKNGILEEIDNTLVYEKETNSYINKSNDFNVSLPEILNDENSISILKENYQVSWKVVNAISSSMQLASTTKESTNKLELHNFEQKAEYKSVFSKENNSIIDLQYELIGQKLKEKIILNQFIENNQISFDYEMTNLELSNDSNKNIIFKNEKDEVIFLFECLYMLDSKGDISTAIEYYLQELGKGQYRITLIPNQEWLKQASYPIVIDPSITVPSSDYFDTYVLKMNPQTNYSSSTYMQIMDFDVSNPMTSFGLINFNMPELLTSEDQMLTYAHLRLQRHNVGGASEEPLYLYENTEFFQSNQVTWDSRPAHESEVVDYAYHSTNLNSYYFDITQSVSKWHSEEDYTSGANRVKGFTIVCPDSADYVRVSSSEYSTPCLEIGYINAAGIKDYWTYNSQSIGFAGTSYVSDYTGMLTFTRNEFNHQTELQTLGLSFVYDINDRNENIGYGKGWKTNYHIRVMSPTISNENTYYIIDATGNKVYYHYLTKCYDTENETGPYKDYYQAEDGSGTVLLIKYDANPGAITGYEQISSNGTKSIFDTSGYLTSITSNNSDSTPVTLTITYVSGNKDQILEVTDTVGNSIVLGYSNSTLVMSRLRLRTEENYSRYVEKANYTYTDGTLTQVVYSKNYEYDGNYTFDGSIDYNYDSSYKLISAQDSDGSKVQFQYETSNRVSKMSSFVKNSPFGELGYLYEYKRTKIIDQDNNFMWFSFDDYGHTVNMLDSKGNVSFNRYLNLFKQYDDISEEDRQLYINLNGTPNYQNNHKLIETSSPQYSIYNPFINSNFEYEIINGYGWIFDNGGNSNCTASVTSSQFFMGEKSLSITTVNNVEASVTQAI
ncbi:MAG: hypothetical protein WC182_05800, partial [Bacilli bacterium]